MKLAVVGCGAIGGVVGAAIGAGAHAARPSMPVPAKPRPMALEPARRKLLLVIASPFRWSNLLFTLPPLGRDAALQAGVQIVELFDYACA